MTTRVNIRIYDEKIYSNYINFSCEESYVYISADSSAMKNVIKYSSLFQTLIIISAHYMHQLRSHNQFFIELIKHFIYFTFSQNGKIVNINQLQSFQPLKYKIVQINRDTDQVWLKILHNSYALVGYE